MAKQPTNNFTPSPKKSIKRHKKNLNVDYLMRIMLVNGS